MKVKKRKIKKMVQKRKASNKVAKLEDKIERYDQLVEFSKLVNSSIDFKKIHRKTVNIIKKLVNCEHVILFRVDAKFHHLFYERYDSKEGYREVRFHIDENTFAGTCAHLGAVLHIKDVTSDIRYAREPDFIRKMKCRNMLLSPLVSDGEVLGVIQAVNSQNLDFTSEDIKFLDAIGNQLSVTLENLNLFKKHQDQFFQVCEALGDTIVKKDTYTGGHTKRVSIFAEMIGKELDLSFQEMNNLKLASILHDIGKIGIEDKILKKAGQLSKEEFEVMKLHPHYGFEILGHIESLKIVVDALKYHHERPDGQGYPYGLTGADIPVLAQIIAVADTFDAMISNRPYRRGLSPMIAYQEILDCSGTQFDPKVVDAFDRAFRKTHMYRPKQLVSIKKAS